MAWWAMSHLCPIHGLAQNSRSVSYHTMLYCTTQCMLRLCVCVSQDGHTVWCNVSMFQSACTYASVHQLNQHFLSCCLARTVRSRGSVHYWAYTRHASDTGRRPSIRHQRSYQTCRTFNCLTLVENLIVNLLLVIRHSKIDAAARILAVYCDIANFTCFQRFCNINADIIIGADSIGTTDIRPINYQGIQARV